MEFAHNFGWAYQVCLFYDFIIFGYKLDTFFSSFPHLKFCRKNFLNFLRKQHQRKFIINEIQFYLSFIYKPKGFCFADSKIFFPGLYKFRKKQLTPMLEDLFIELESLAGVYFRNLLLKSKDSFFY